MTPKEIASTFFDQSIRVDQVIPLAFQADQYGEALTDWWQENRPEDNGMDDVTAVEYEKLNKLFSDGAGREVRFNDILTDSDVEGFMQEAYHENVLGFLVQASTPIPTRFHADGGFESHGFGWCTLKWFYTEALDGAFAQRLIKWQEDFIAEKRAAAKEGVVE